MYKKLVTRMMVLAVDCVTFFAESLHAEPNAQVAAILEAGWGNSSDSLDAAKRQFSRASGDSRVDYAMALVTLRHRQYDEAQKLLESAVAKDRTNLPAWRAIFWLEMFTQKFDASLARMRSLAKLYPESKARAEVEEDLKESAAWMGHLIGFLQGPGEKAVAAETLAAHSKAIAEELKGPWRQTFDTGNQQVLDQYYQLQEQLVKERNQALEEEKQKKADELKTIEQDRSRINDELTNLKSQAGAAKSDLDSKLSEIDKYLAPVVRRGREIERQAEPILRRVRDIRVRLSRAEADERSAGDDKGQRDRARREADRLRNDLRREEIRLRPYETELRRAQAEAAKLASQRSAATNRYQNTLRAISIGRQKLQRTEKTLDKKERIFKQPATGRTPKVSDLERRLKALTTYRTFPLEEARLSLLEALRKGA